MTLQCVDECIAVWRKFISSVTTIPLSMILNGESIRGPELVTVKNGQKVPIGYDEDCIVFYCDPIDTFSVIDNDSAEKDLTLQSYELHLIIYGNKTKMVIQLLRSNLMSQEAIQHLRENGISILQVLPAENTSEFMTSQTYVLRSDLRIQFDSLFENSKWKNKVNIENAEINKEAI